MHPEPPDQRGSRHDVRRPLRADARRNRARVLEAADAVFASEGPSTTTEAVARAAGVGVGTVFRHFPTKDALLEAVFVARLEMLAEEASALADAEDPGAAFFGFFTRVIEQSANRHTFAAALAATSVDVEHTTAVTVGDDLLDALDHLLVRAQEAGAVREDVSVSEVIALLVGTTRAAEHAGWDPTVQARTLAVVCDGLRPATDATP
jgi:AcrR family transcriptional regulator